LSAALQALWWDAKGNWQKAHERAQEPPLEEPALLPYDEVRWFSTALATLTCPALSTVTVPTFLVLPFR
jgi:hypothetical protein